MWATGLFLLLGLPCVYLSLQIPAGPIASKTAWVMLMSGLAGAVAYALIPVFAALNERKNLFGKDLGKRHTEQRDRHVCVGAAGAAGKGAAFGMDARTTS